MTSAPKRFSWEELNAYVDGEADLRLAAEIASEAASDRATAEAIAMLSELKAASAEALATDPPVTVLRARTRPRHVVRTIQAMAAVVVAAVAIAAMLFLTWTPAGNRLDLRAEAVAMHEAWSDRNPEGSIGIAARPKDGVAMVEIGGRLVSIPALAFARMRIGHVAVESTSGSSGLFVGYVGRNSCRLGLLIAPAPASQMPATTDVQGGLRIATWETSGLFYAAVAQDMDPARFLAITQHLQTVTRPAPDLEDDILIASRPPIAHEPCVS